MTKDQLTEIEKQIAEKVKVAEPKKKGGKFTVDVKRMKALAEKLNRYENTPHAPSKY